MGAEVGGWKRIGGGGGQFPRRGELCLLRVYLLREFSGQFALLSPERGEVNIPDRKVEIGRYGGRETKNRYIS